ncbi:hypothetical protein [Solitalea koreensis]|uniref:Outer membrane protein beta-barrel domain-containing protein n=1 Tax=Solitalea koreensis TaxID=543615 RepID=A0A521C539_9SPHI|nr:hypothetical protein [Solitalea koreensis]SMO54455.1 hypothetical protein SAMN06265350_103212 [Solitalea koreensis]
MKKQLQLLLYSSTLLMLMLNYANGQNTDSNPGMSDVKKNDSLPEQTKQQIRRQKIEAKPWYVSRYSIIAGGFFPVNNTKVKVSNNTGTEGDEIDFEDDLGLNRHTSTFSFGGDVHLGKRHRLELLYYRFYRSATHTIDRDIHFKDTVFAVNTSVSSFFHNDIYRFSYGYAFISNSKAEAGLSFGAHIMRTNVGLEGIGNNQNVTASTDYGFTAPLPDFGIWGGYAFNPKWAVIGEFDYFTLKINDVKGRILGANVAVKYKALDRLAITAGYTGFNFRVDVTREKFNGFFKWGYNGPGLSVNYLIGVKGKGPNVN